MVNAFLTPLLGGILLACCLLPAPAHWLAWISLVPAAAAMTRRDHVVASYLGMYFAGLAFNLITTDWIRTLGEGTGLSGSSAPDWVFQAELLALFWPFTLWLGRFLVAKRAIAMGLALPAVWIVHELLLRTIWALVDQTGWHINFLGYAIVGHRYISQIADLGGVSAMTFVAACTSGAAWDVLHQWQSQGDDHLSRFQITSSVALAIALVVLSFGYGAWAIHCTRFETGPTIWLMPETQLAGVPAELPWKPEASGAPDVLLWSELAYTGPPVSAPSATIDYRTSAKSEPREPKAEQALERLCGHFAVPMVVGYMRVDDSAEVWRKYNSAAYVDPTDGFKGSYDKIGLVPWTEFTPMRGLTSRRSAGFTHGTSVPVFTLSCGNTGRTYRFGSAICYDVVFPQLFRRYMRAADSPPDFFLVCSSERSDTTGRMSSLVLRLAKARAIECRRALVRNVNFGYSGIIDSTGQLRNESLPLVIQSPTPLGRVPVDRRSTLYMRWGDWISATIACIVFLAAIAKCCERCIPSLQRRQRQVQNVTGSS